MSKGNLQRLASLKSLGISERETCGCILSYVKEITSPDPMHEIGCSGLVHWDDPEKQREVGGEFRMGNTYKSMADSCQCMAKTTTIL